MRTTPAHTQHFLCFHSGRFHDFRDDRPNFRWPCAGELEAPSSNLVEISSTGRLQQPEGSSLVSVPTGNNVLVTCTGNPKTWSCQKVEKSIAGPAGINVNIRSASQNCITQSSRFFLYCLLENVWLHLLDAIFEQLRLGIRSSMTYMYVINHTNVCSNVQVCNRLSKH